MMTFWGGSAIPSRTALAVTGSLLISLVTAAALLPGTSTGFSGERDRASDAPVLNVVKDCDDPQSYPGINIVGDGFVPGESIQVGVKFFRNGEQLHTPPLDPYSFEVEADEEGHFEAHVFYEPADQFDVTVSGTVSGTLSQSVAFDCPWHDPVPQIRLRIVPKHFPFADSESNGGRHKGAYISVQFSEPVTVALRIRRFDAPRLGGPPPKFSRSFAIDGTGDGLNIRNIHFVGRVGQHRFPPGRYSVSAVARDEVGQPSEKVSKTFRITRR